MVAKKSSKPSPSTSLLDKYIEGYLSARPDPAEYEEYINQQMQAFDEREKQRLEEMERLANEPDEDGFVSVVSKKPVILESDEDEGASTKTKSKARELPNFYQTNKASQNQNDIEKLMNKFDEDRKRLADLKKSKLLQ